MEQWPQFVSPKTINMSSEYSYIIIEDSEKVCNGIKERMDEFVKWKLITYAHHVTDAVEQVLANKPNLIFLDWSLKGGSAYEVLQQIQNVRGYNPYIIFNTGYQNENPEIPQEIINNYNIDKYIVKPVFEKLRQHLCVYLKEAEAKAKNNNISANINYVWIEDTERNKIKIDAGNIICICQNPADARSRIIYLSAAPYNLQVPYTWDKCTSLLEDNNISFFISKARESVLNKSFIEKFEKPFVRLKGVAFKIEVTKEKIREFEDWLFQY